MTFETFLLLNIIFSGVMFIFGVGSLIFLAIMDRRNKRKK